jgi:glycosyltransferase involved in cell wall biosynthesis
MDHSIFYPKPWNLILTKLESNENYIDDNKSDYDISIIMPTYNNINYLDETFRSVIFSGLGYKIEILVGIDGCQKTYDFIRNNKFPAEIKFFYFNENGGPYTIKNTLAKIAKSENIVFFDSDDLMGEDFISTIIKTLKNFDIIKFRYVNFTNRNYMFQKAKKKLDFAEGVFGVKRSLFLEMNGFEPWMCAADSDFWGRIYKRKPKIFFTNNVLMYRRLHDEQLTRRQDTGMRSALRAKYWNISKSKTGDGNPSKLSTRKFKEIEKQETASYLTEEFKKNQKKTVLTQGIAKILLNNSITKKENEPLKEKYNEIDYDVINNLKSKRFKPTQDTEYQNVLIENRQELFNLKRKKN